MLSSKGTVEAALGGDNQVAMSTEMETAIASWMDLYKGKLPWLKAGDRTLGLPAAIAAEIAKMVTLEMQVNITGDSERAKYLREQFRQVEDNMRLIVEYACAGGGIALKPYIDSIEEKTIAVDINTADMFFPLAFNSRKEITSACFLERKVDGRNFYTRMEVHEYRDGKCAVSNKAFVSSNKDDLGARTILSSIPEWSHLSEEPVIIENVDCVLFSYFKIPFGNTVDPLSPLGVSVYSRAVGLIEDADRQYNRLLWEYEGGELAIDASQDIFPMENGRVVVPQGRERLFRPNNLDPTTTSGDNLIKTFSPALRNENFYFGLNKILMRIEDTIGLARGTIAEQTETAKTATEIKMTKQRTYSTVSDIQSSLQAAIETLITAMDRYTTLYNLAPAGKYEVNFYFDDSISTDSDKEKENDWQDVDRGLMSKWEYRMKWYGEDEATAKKKIAEMDEAPTDDEILGFGQEPAARGE